MIATRGFTALIITRGFGLVEGQVKESVPYAFWAAHNRFSHDAGDKAIFLGQKDAYFEGKPLYLGDKCQAQGDRLQYLGEKCRYLGPKSSWIRKRRLAGDKDCRLGNKARLVGKKPWRGDQ